MHAGVDMSRSPMEVYRAGTFGRQTSRLNLRGKVQMTMRIGDVRRLKHGQQPDRMSRLERTTENLINYNKLHIVPQASQLLT